MAPKKNYTPEQMGRALEAVRRGDPVATAAKKYGVPRITLRNKVVGKSPVVCSMGPPTILVDTEELLLVNWMIGMSERHCPVGKDQLLDSVQQIVTLDKRSTPFTDNRPGKKWFKAFFARHPELAIRVAQNLTKTRDSVTEEQIRAWFSEVEKYFAEQNLSDILKDSKRVFNADESAFFLNPKGGHVIVKRGEKNVYTRSGNEKENLTVLVTANAAGQLPPPMIILSYERVPGYIANSIPEDWGIGRSESGWMCGRTFFEYMTNIFYPWLIKSGIPLPIIFFLDGHASHLTLHLSQFCANNQIELIALYPNSTHLLQPMDIAVFRPLKVFYKKCINKWKSEHLRQEVKKENFGPIVEASLREISTDTIKNGFRAGGIQPFGPDYVDFSKLNKKNGTENNVVTSNSVPSAEDNNFLKKLETEIINTYCEQKLSLFKECFYKDREKLQEQLPNEDLSLHILWAKYKHKCHILGHEAAAVGTPLKQPPNSAPSNPVTAAVLSGNNESEIMVSQSIHDHKDVSTPIVNIQSLYTQDNAISKDNNLQPILIQDKQSFEHSTPVKSNSDKSFANYMLNQSNVIVPSPFKKALFWPESEPDKKKRRVKKEKIPSVITSLAWREYSEKKQSEKKAKEDEKEKRKLEREEKKRLKEMNTKTKQEQKKKGLPKISNEKLNLKRKRKQTKESSSSDDETDSNVTYIETGESEFSEMEIEFLEEDDTEVKKTQEINEISDDPANQNVVEVKAIEERPKVNLENKENILQPSQIQTDHSGKNKIVVNGDNTEKNIDIKVTENKRIKENTRQSPKVHILNEVAVNILLDDKTGKLIAMPQKHDSDQLEVKDSTNDPDINKFVLVKFHSAKAKMYRYVCFIKNVFPDRMLVQGCKSKKSKAIYKIVESDISIIDKKDIIEYLPQPEIKNGYIFFDNEIDVKEL